MRIDETFEKVFMQAFMSDQVPIMSDLVLSATQEHLMHLNHRKYGKSVKDYGIYRGELRWKKVFPSIPVKKRDADA